PPPDAVWHDPVGKTCALHHSSDASRFRNTKTKRIDGNTLISQHSNMASTSRSSWLRLPRPKVCLDCLDKENQRHLADQRYAHAVLPRPHVPPDRHRGDLGRASLQQSDGHLRHAYPPDGLLALGGANHVLPRLHLRPHRPRALPPARPQA